MVDEELQIFGGYRYIGGNYPDLAYRNARINRIWERTNEINRIVIGSTLVRGLSKGWFDLAKAFQTVYDEIQRLRPLDFDLPENLEM